MRKAALAVGLLISMGMQAPKEVKSLRRSNVCSGKRYPDVGTKYLYILGTALWREYFNACDVAELDAMRKFAMNLTLFLEVQIGSIASTGKIINPDAWAQYVQERMCLHFLKAVLSAKKDIVREKELAYKSAKLKIERLKREIHNAKVAIKTRMLTSEPYLESISALLTIEAEGVASSPRLERMRAVKKDLEKKLQQEFSLIFD